MTDGNGNEDQKPGPEPERLKLPDEDWKDALRRALGIEHPPEDESDEKDDAGEATQ